MHNRICLLIKSLGITQMAFSSQLNVSRAFISQICSGSRIPSDRTISDICREFDVNEEWLRTGEGEMFRELSREEAVTDFFAEILREPDSFRFEFARYMAQLTPDQWEAIRSLVDSLKNLDTTKKPL